MHGVFVLTILTIAHNAMNAVALCDLEPDSRWTAMFVRYNATDENDDCTYSGPYKGFIETGHPDNYQNFDKRQYLHFREATAKPSPVFFHAHGSGGKADSGINDVELETIINQGYAVIAWESVTNLGGLEAGEVNGQIGMDDFKLVIEWAIRHANEYGFDKHRFVIGGHSRGSIFSWSMAQSHHEKYTISGVYMSSALPIGDEDKPWDPSGFPLVDVTINSPRTHFVYFVECPTDPPQASCDVVEDLGGDIHNPWHGQKIVSKYEDLGIGAKIELEQGCDCQTNWAQHFPDFASTLVPPHGCAPALEWACPSYGHGTVEACSDCARSNERVLEQAGCTLASVQSLCSGDVTHPATTHPGRYLRGNQ
jgi:hypothetical protein